MKKLILLLLLISVFKARPQAYIPMLNSYAEWHVTNCYFGCMTDKYYTIGDTVIDGLHYKFLDMYHYMKNFVIREDTSLQRIYMRFLASSKPTEYLLYDFKLNVNDTMAVVNPNSPYPQSAGNFVLDSIRSKPLLNKNYRYFYLHSLDTTVSLTKNTVWVEGIGSLCLINTPGAPPQINGVGQLSCFFNGGIQEYEDLDSISSCQSVYPISVKEEIRFKNAIKLFPNPGSKLLEIRSDNFDPEGKKLEIMNAVGTLVESIEYKKSIDISSYPNGIYFLRILADNESCTLKFIKE